MVHSMPAVPNRIISPTEPVVAVAHRRHDARRIAAAVVGDLVLKLAGIAVDHARRDLDVELRHFLDRPPQQAAKNELRRLAERIVEKGRAHEPLAFEPALRQAPLAVNQVLRVVVVGIRIEVDGRHTGLEVKAIGAPRLGGVPHFLPRIGQSWLIGALRRHRAHARHGQCRERKRGERARPRAARAGRRGRVAAAEQGMACGQQETRGATKAGRHGTPGGKVCVTLPRRPGLFHPQWGMSVVIGPLPQIAPKKHGAAALWQGGMRRRGRPVRQWCVLPACERGPG